MLHFEEVRMRPKCWVAGWMLMMVLGLVACNRGAPAAEATGVRIEKKTEVLKREGKEAVVRYPVFSGLPPAILKELQGSAGLKAGTDSSLEEWKADFEESWWLSEIDYEVTYNRHDFLVLTYSVSGVGAYPDTFVKDLVVDLKTGRRLAVKDLFKPALLQELAAKVDRLRQAEVEKTLQEHRLNFKENPDPSDPMTEEDLAATMEPATQSRFSVESFDTFRLDDKGVTFIYDFGFPHVSQALEPSGEYFLSYEELRPYINPEGPLARIH
jgi:hypothetical protein